MSKPLAIDLFCGLGGWTEGLLAEGWDVIGFDIERHQYGDHCYPARLIVQDVLTLHGSQFRNADFIVASPPCQEFSYMAMPWAKAKAKAAAIRADKTGAERERLTRLFNACFRIQREACEAAGRHIPLIVENVRGAQPWVGRARWSFGSFYLWGDVPALMPHTHNRLKGGQTNWRDHGKPGYRGDQLQDHFKSSGMNWSDRTKTGQDFTRVAGNQAIKNEGGSWFRVSHNNVPHCRGDNLEGRKFTICQPGDKTTAQDQVASSHGVPRKFASALIAKIPLPLSRHIAATFRRAANSD